MNFILRILQCNYWMIDELTIHVQLITMCFFIHHVWRTNNAKSPWYVASYVRPIW